MKEFKIKYSTATKEYFSKREYCNLSNWNQKINQAWKEKKELYHSAKFYNGTEELIPFIFIDIDDKHSLQNALDSTRALSRYLGTVFGEKSIKTFFSGSKGFHLYLNFVDEEKNPLFSTDNGIRNFFTYLNENILPNTAKIDLKAVGFNRVIRALNSLNLKSGKFKIDLGNDIEKLTLNQILEKSNSPNLSKKSLENLIGIPEGDIIQDISEYTKILTYLAEAKEIAPPNALKKTKDTSTLAIKNTTSSYSTEEVVSNCRAVRNLVYEISNKREQESWWRLYLSRALACTDKREIFIHAILACSGKYDREVTSSRLNSSKNYSINCAEMFSAGICKEICQRYLTGTGEIAASPSYFGIGNNNNKWFRYTSADSIEKNIRRLIKYFSTSTDFFDWGNLLNIHQNIKSYSLYLSDQIRKGQMPTKATIIYGVIKPDGSIRDLSLNHIETEVYLSCFVKELAKENSKIVANYPPGFFSFGYINDGGVDDLILPWMDDYNNYKEKISFFISKGSYGHVLADDIKTFYPQFTESHVAKTLRLYSELDVRIINAIEGYFNCTNYFSSLKNQKITPKGISQGPLISHIVAARFLIEVDLFIQNSMGCVFR